MRFAQPDMPRDDKLQALTFRIYIVACVAAYIDYIDKVEQSICVTAPFTTTGTSVPDRLTVTGKVE